MRIWGNGEVIRDYLHIDDLIAFTVAAGAGRQTGVVNVGSGLGHSLNQIVSFVRAATGEALPVAYASKRDFDVAEIVLDISRAKADFGWCPAISLSEGIRATWQAVKCQANPDKGLTQ